MMWLYLLALIVIGIIVVVLVGRWEGAAAPKEEYGSRGDDDVDLLLERARAEGIAAHDLEEVQFDSAVRGYRMDQVDRLIDALAAQLRKTPDGDDIRPE